MESLARGCTGSRDHTDLEVRGLLTGFTALVTCVRLVLAVHISTISHAPNIILGPDTALVLEPRVFEPINPKR